MLWIEKYHWIGYLIIIGFIILIWQFPSVEDSITDIKFNMRGNTKTDSSIVILYLNNDDIKNLGGYPIPRVYYAVAINALKEIGVGAIGLNMVFENSNSAYPEYDTLLADAIKSCGNVVLAKYNTSEDITDHSDHSDLLTFIKNKPVQSFQLIRENIESGFTNISAKQPIRKIHYRYPVKSPKGESLSSFSEKLLQEYEKHVKRNLPEHRIFRSAFENSYLIRLNYAGDRNVYHSYPFISFLKSYDSLSLGMDVTFPFTSLRNSIVIIGVIAEGLSQFVSTPLDDHFPVTLLHATALDTIIQEKFLTPVDFNWVLLLCVILTLFIKRLKYRSAKTCAMTGIVFLFLFLIINQILFSYASINLSVLIPIFAIIVPFTEKIIVILHSSRESLIISREQIEELQEQIIERNREIKILRNHLESEDVRENSLQELKTQIETYEKEVITLKQQLDDVKPSSILKDLENIQNEFEGIVYSSSGPMKDIVQQLRSVATEEVTVMLYGESGTGKELAARLIHRLSNRRGKEFIAVNCGALTETLLESELFGYEKGAFTGADRTHIGRFERANGGTLFLDEIAETSEAFQVKLLRVLQEGEFERVGANQTISVDVRIIAATNKDLKQFVAEKKFREDLYYRLHVIPITLPPLRERKMDIPLLINFYLKKNNSDIAIADSVINALQMYRWRGNVRELESVLMRAMILVKTGSRKIIRLSDLPPEIVQEVRKQSDLSQLILEMLQRKEFAHGSINLVAQELGGLDRSTVTEYFRGIVFQTYIDSIFDVDAAVRKLSQSSDHDVRARVEKKINEYLNNLEKEIDRTQPIEALLPIIHSRYKNLPQKFHDAVESIVRHLYQAV